jgi:hypothetical protein
MNADCSPLAVSGVTARGLLIVSSARDASIDIPSGSYQEQFIAVWDLPVHGTIRVNPRHPR